MCGLPPTAMFVLRHRLATLGTCYEIWAILQEPSRCSVRRLRGGARRSAIHTLIRSYRSTVVLLLQDQGDLAQAESLLREALAGTLGDTHPDTLTSLSSLGSLLHEKKDSFSQMAVHPPLRGRGVIGSLENTTVP